MALKPLTEKKLAHKVFKFYKAVGSFPPDVSPLKAYQLLAKYNYFIAANIDKKVVNTLTELCNIIDREKVLIVYGDFLLSTLYLGVESFKYNEKTETKLIYIDCITDKPEEVIGSSATTSSLFKTYIIYIIDNIDRLNKKSVKFLLDIQDKLFTSNKAIICCTMLLDKVDLQLKNKYKKIKLGKYTDNKLTLKNYAYLLFNEKDRDKVIHIFSENKLPNAYFLGLISYNLPLFYADQVELFINLKVIEKVNTMLYKVSNHILLNYFVYSIKPTTVKKPIRFPSKIDKKPKVILKKTTNNITKRAGQTKSISQKKSSKPKKTTVEPKRQSVLKY